jgi:membrane protease YdiL (CAAX protease family)
MEADKISIKSPAFAIAAVLVIELMARVALTDRIVTPLAGLGITRLLEVFVMLIVVYLAEKRLDVIGLSPGQILPGIRKGLIWAAGFGVIAGLSIFILLAFGFNALKMMRVNLTGGPPEIMLFFIVAALIGPVAEEIFFRGILYGFFRRWGVFAALVITTLLFVFSHPTRTGLPITQAVGGIVFALAYEIEGSLMVPIVIHCLGNLAIFSLGFLT